jgi:hypothetical protein
MLSRIPDGQRGVALSVGSGWYSLITELDAAIAALRPDYVIYQVKEKYGTLRYYCSWDGDKSVRELIAGAEALSRVTCERCGAPGQLGEAEGWWRTACAEHAPEDFVVDGEPAVIRIGVLVELGALN